MRSKADSSIAEKVSAKFPWLLYAFCCPILFLLYNQIDAPSRPYGAQSVSDIANAAQDGNFLIRVLTVALGATGAFLLSRYPSRSVES